MRTPSKKPSSDTMTTVDGGCEESKEVARREIKEALDCCDNPEPEVMLVETYPDAEKWSAPGYCENCVENFNATLVMHAVEID